LTIFVVLFLCVLGMGPNLVSAQDEEPVAWWRFESADAGAILDEAGQIPDAIGGNFKIVAGVTGRALRLDGFTTVITREAEKAPRLDGSFTMDGWVAVAAYPWNWCPVIAQEKEEKSGFFFGIGPQGHLGFHAAFHQSWLTCVSRQKIPLRKWTHVAAVYEPSVGIRLYVDGALSGELAVRDSIAAAREVDLLIGMNRTPILPSHAVPPGAGTLPSWFSLDGILDEVRIFGRAFSSDEIARIAQNDSAASIPDIPPRVFPSGPPGPGRFGAYYTRLKYYEEWDALWPIAEHSDVVVQFDDSPVRVVFWRGLRYSPAWVTENGLWLADQSGESGNAEGCIEHMQDIHCLYSHVRIIENTPARAVVHWRYAPVSSRNNLWTADERTGWAWWMDEYYTFYPDGTGVRKIRWRRPESGHEFPWLQNQETSVLCHPGQNAVDVLAYDAITLVNLDGESHTYSWPDDDSMDTRERRNLPRDPSIIRDLRPDDPNIQVVNMRAKAKPFVIFEPGNRPLVYVGRVREQLVHFPAYNHWPVCQVFSDGRFVQAADRGSSFSISYHTPVRHQVEGNVVWAAMLYGATFGKAVDLVPLARSWVNPPELRIASGAFESHGYEVSRRAYVLQKSQAAESGRGESGGLILEFQATGDSPLTNTCLELLGWGEGGIEVVQDGRRLTEGEDFRSGRRRTLQAADLLLWLEISSSVPIRITVRDTDRE